MLQKIISLYKNKTQGKCTFQCHYLPQTDCLRTLPIQPWTDRAPALLANIWTIQNLAVLPKKHIGKEWPHAFDFVSPHLIHHFLSVLCTGQETLESIWTLCVTGTISSFTRHTGVIKVGSRTKYRAPNLFFPTVY
jgi:hypothetical protein